MAENRRVFYIFDKCLRDATNKIPNIKLRSAIVHALFEAYKLRNRCIVTEITPAVEEELLSFHSATYIDHLKKAQESLDLEKVIETEETAEFNLEYDCPLFDNILDFAKIIAGGTLTAARLLCENKNKEERALGNGTPIKPKSYLKYKEKRGVTSESSIYDLPGDLTLDEDSLEVKSSPLPKRMRKIFTTGSQSENTDENVQKVALNWFGGWHHAQRDSAEGFCYVNDIVIGIQELLSCFKRILYVDLDIHHGNGVENAFAHTSRVLTLSIHKHGHGFYPGTGSLEDIGISSGRYYTVNVPLNDGITDEPYKQLFFKIVDKIRTVYQPHCIVVQCGADGLSGDPLGGFNLTAKGLATCVERLLSWGLPTLLLGGGGYNLPNAARFYAYLTSVAIGTEISNDIPDNDFFHLFGPGFELSVGESLRKNENSESYMDFVLSSVLKNLDKIKIEDNCVS